LRRAVGYRLISADMFLEKSCGIGPHICTVKDIQNLMTTTNFINNRIMQQYIKMERK
jgi:hypothetical protein